MSVNPTCLITPSMLSLFSLSPVIGAWWKELEARGLFEGAKPESVLWTSSSLPMACATSRCRSPNWKSRVIALPACRVVG